MEIAALLALKRAPISSLAFPFTEVSESIAQVDSNVFLLLTKFGPGLSALPEPEVSQVAWAASLGALRRVLNFDIEADDGVLLTPPPEMTFGPAQKYGELLSSCRRKWPSSIFETASYRIASDGKFICRNIATPGVAYHFRSPKHNVNEVPFVIKHRLVQG